MTSKFLVHEGKQMVVEKIDSPHQLYTLVSIWHYFTVLPWV